MVVDRQSQSGSERATTTPIVIVEVLSPSTDLDHHGEKLSRYQVRERLVQYLVLEQKRPLAYVWICEGGIWPDAATIVEGLNGRVLLPAIAAEIDLAEIYRPVSTS